VSGGGSKNQNFTNFIFSPGHFLFVIDTLIWNKSKN
jgi:hypothetical protein